MPRSVTRVKKDPSLLPLARSSRCRCAGQRKLRHHGFVFLHQMVLSHHLTPNSVARPEAYGVLAPRAVPLKCAAAGTSRPRPADSASSNPAIPGQCFAEPIPNQLDPCRSPLDAALCGASRSLDAPHGGGGDEKTPRFRKAGVDFRQPDHRRGRCRSMQDTGNGKTSGASGSPDRPHFALAPAGTPALPFTATAFLAVQTFAPTGRRP